MNLYGRKVYTFKSVEEIAKRKINAEKARAAKKQKWYEKIYTEAASKYRPTKTGSFTETELKKEKFISRIQTISTVENKSEKQAYKEVMETLSFMSSEENYKLQIQKALTAAERAEIRKHLAQKLGTKYKDTAINFNEWVYDSTTMSVVDPGHNVEINIVDGTNSTDPSFLNIKLL